MTPRTLWAGCGGTIGLQAEDPRLLPRVCTTSTSPAPTHFFVSPSPEQLGGPRIFWINSPSVPLKARGEIIITPGLTRHVFFCRAKYSEHLLEHLIGHLFFVVHVDPVFLYFCHPFRWKFMSSIRAGVIFCIAETGVPKQHEAGIECLPQAPLSVTLPARAKCHDGTIYCAREGNLPTSEQRTSGEKNITPCRSRACHDTSGLHLGREHSAPSRLHSLSNNRQSAN